MNKWLWILILFPYGLLLLLVYLLSKGLSWWLKPETRRPRDKGI